MIPDSHSIEAPFYQTQNLADESFRFIELLCGDAGCSWHFHPEFQLGCVVQGGGTRVIGDDVQEIQTGEVTLLGENLPHVWHFDPLEPDAGVQMYVVHFRKDFLGADFFRRPELCELQVLLDHASKGLQVTGATRDQAEKIMRGMASRDGFDRLMDLLSLLRLLSKSATVRTLCTIGYQPLTDEAEVERVRRVCEYVESHYADDVDRETVAALVHLSPGAFSRFFKRHTGTTFQEYVNEVRIGFACRMLMTGNLSITQIALRTGYADVTAFNRSFRRVKSMNPTEYKNRTAKAKS